MAGGLKRQKENQRDETSLEAIVDLVLLVEILAGDIRMVVV